MDFENIYKLNEVISDQTYGGEFGDLDDNDNEVAFDIKYDDALDIMKEAVNKIAKMFEFSNCDDIILNRMAETFVEKLINCEEERG